MSVARALDEPVPEGMPHALPLVARELALGIRAPHEVAADALHVLVADALELSNGVGTVGLGVSKCLGDAFDERATFERWEIHRSGANRSLSRGGEASSLIMDIRIGIP